MTVICFTFVPNALIKHYLNSHVMDAIISILIRSVIFKKESEGGINKK